MAATMPTTIKPTYTGVSKNISTRVLRTDFGDGYQQRSGNGINNIGRIYDLEYVGSNTDIDELVDHFVERAGYQDFTYTFPNEAT
jgi:phage-related protein